MLVAGVVDGNLTFTSNQERSSGRFIHVIFYIKYGSRDVGIYCDRFLRSLELYDIDHHELSASKSRQLVSFGANLIKICALDKSPFCCNIS